MLLHFHKVFNANKEDQVILFLVSFLGLFQFSTVIGPLNIIPGMFFPLVCQPRGPRADRACSKKQHRICRYFSFIFSVSCTVLCVELFFGASGSNV